MPRRNRFPASFAFRLADEDAVRLREVAEAHGYRPAEWARKIVSDVIAVDFVRRNVRLRVLHADLLRMFLGELSRQGNNLNQIAHALNRGEGGSSQTIARELDAIRRNNQVIMVAVLDALGANDNP